MFHKITAHFPNIGEANIMAAVSYSSEKCYFYISAFL